MSTNDVSEIQFEESLIKTSHCITLFGIKIDFKVLIIKQKIDEKKTVNSEP